MRRQRDCVCIVLFGVYRKEHTLNVYMAPVYIFPSPQITDVNQFCSAMKSRFISAWYQMQTCQSISGSKRDEGAMDGWMETRSPSEVLKQSQSNCLLIVFPEAVSQTMFNVQPLLKKQSITL